MPGPALSDGAERVTGLTGDPTHSRGGEGQKAVQEKSLKVRVLRQWEAVTAQCWRLVCAHTLWEEQWSGEPLELESQGP